jgi:hypothetical protein
MNRKIQFELFKRFYGVILTPTNVDQAVQYSQAAGCGGPGYPVFCETTSESREMERIAKRLARRYDAGFEVMSQIKGKEKIVIYNCTDIEREISDFLKVDL